MVLGQFDFSTDSFIFTFSPGVFSEHRVFMQGGRWEGVQPRTGRCLPECHWDKVRHLSPGQEDLRNVTETRWDICQWFEECRWDNLKQGETKATIREEFSESRNVTEMSWETCHGPDTVDVTSAILVKVQYLKAPICPKILVIGGVKYLGQYCSQRYCWSPIYSRWCDFRNIGVQVMLLSCCTIMQYNAVVLYCDNNAV